MHNGCEFYTKPTRMYSNWLMNVVRKFSSCSLGLLIISPRPSVFVCILYVILPEALTHQIEMFPRTLGGWDTAVMRRFFNQAFYSFGRPSQNTSSSKYFAYYHYHYSHYSTEPGFLIILFLYHPEQKRCPTGYTI